MQLNSIRFNFSLILYSSKKRKEAKHTSCDNISFNQKIRELECAGIYHEHPRRLPRLRSSFQRVKSDGWSRDHFGGKNDWKPYHDTQRVIHDLSRGVDNCHYYHKEKRKQRKQKEKRKKKANKKLKKKKKKRRPRPRPRPRLRLRVRVLLTPVTYALKKIKNSQLFDNSNDGYIILMPIFATCK